MAAPPRPRAVPVATAAAWLAVVTAAVFVGLHVAVVRPTSFPAGAGLVLENGPLAGALADPQALRLPRPPDVTQARPDGLAVLDVVPDGPAAAAGIAAGDRVRRMTDAEGRTLDLTGDRSAARAVDDWRAAWWLDVRRPITLSVARGAEVRDVKLDPRWFPDLPAGSWPDWMERHLGPIIQMIALLAAAIVMLLLGVRDRIAPLMTQALLGNIFVTGTLVGAEAWLPGLVRGPFEVAAWLMVPVTFPAIGWAVLNFPSPAPSVTRWPWLPWALLALAAPLVVANTVAALHLLGVTAASPLLTAFATRPWIWPAAFVVGVLTNTAIVAEGVRRYRRNPDQSERRRIMVVVYTGVPAAFAWALGEALPLAGALLGHPIALPWAVTAMLRLAMLLPAFGLPYAVAVRHVFSPRTVLRSSLQYALARKTLTLLAILPAVPLVVSLVRQRDLSLAQIVTGQPLFYLAGIAVLAAARHYRERAARWLDRRFFRAEYDARQILMSLAGRVPFETDPAELVALVVQQVRSALHPESIAVLAEIEPDRFDTLGATGAAPRPLPASSGLTTMLRWSREPLELFLDDDRSTAARLPADDRAWIAEAGVNLAVPLLAGNAADPTLVGFVALGRKQSDEPYSPEDRQLLTAIAAQMVTGLDLARARRRATARPDAEAVVTALPPATEALGHCPRCHRCVPAAAGVCPDDGTSLELVPGVPAVVDGKYRVDGLVGRGGMGAVFRARDVRLDRDVAIKMVRADLLGSADARRRFRREAQVVARLQHPAVVAVFDYGTVGDGAAYIVMELVRGEDLRQRMRRQPPLGAADVVALVSRIADGVQAAHDAEVLHRDLKPENVVLSERGGEPKVLDFGVARHAPEMGDPDGTRTGGMTVVGTPAYMAPEQLRGQPLDGRADVFSLGVMTFELLTGRLPYGAGSFVDIGVAHADGRVHGVDGLPDALRAVVLQALAADPGARPESPAAFAAALRAAAARVPAGR